MIIPWLKLIGMAAILAVVSGLVWQVAKWKSDAEKYRILYEGEKARVEMMERELAGADQVISDLRSADKKKDEAIAQLQGMADSLQTRVDASAMRIQELQRKIDSWHPQPYSSDCMTALWQFAQREGASP